MTSTSLRETVGSTHVTGAGILAAKTGGVNVRTGSADLYGTGTGTSEGGLTLLSAVRLEGGAAVAVVGVRDFHTKSQVVGYGTLVASGGRMVTASAQLVGSGLLAVTEGEPVIGVTYLEARQELYVQVQAGRRLFEDLQARQGSHAQLEAQQALYVQLVAAYALYTQLGGSIDMTKQNQDFSMYAGNSKFIRFRVDGAQDLTGASFRWIVRGSGGTEAVLDKTSGDGITVEGGEAQIKLTPADTKNLVGRYYHECAMTDESGNVSTIFIGNVTFNKSYI